MKRSLSRDEAALWARVASTVRPMAGRAKPPPEAQQVVPLAPGGHGGSAPGRVPGAALSLAVPNGRVSPPSRPAEDIRTRPLTLDASWDRKLAQGTVTPDFTIDLHGHSLEAAHARLDHALALALAQGARVVLLITGRARPSDGQGGRSERRGAIRAKFLDWLAHGSHAGRIAAIRPAHPRHGGAGAVYLILRRPR